VSYERKVNTQIPRKIQKLIFVEGQKEEADNSGKSR
jgi:hypothetical protein